MPSRIRLLAFDIDGTLTDATTYFGGAEIGWTQRYSVRDGEALLRLERGGLAVVPLSRNKTAAAKHRMERLGFALDWVGVDDKVAALDVITTRFGVSTSEVCFIGDGVDDGQLFPLVGFGVAVADAHPDARAAAHHVLDAPGGRHAIEELELLLRRSDRL